MSQNHEISYPATVKQSPLKSFSEGQCGLQKKLRDLILTILKSHASALKLENNQTTTEQSQNDSTGSQINKLIRNKIIQYLSSLAQVPERDRRAKDNKILSLFEFEQERSYILQRIPDSWSQFAIQSLQSYSSQLQLKINEIINWLQSYILVRGDDTIMPDSLVSQIIRLCQIFEILVQNLGNKSKPEQQHNYYLTKLLKFKTQQGWSSQFMSAWLNMKKSAQTMNQSDLVFLINQWFDQKLDTSKPVVKNTAVKISRKGINPQSIQKALNAQQLHKKTVNDGLQQQRKQARQYEYKQTAKNELIAKRQRLFTNRLYETFRLIQKHYNFVGDSGDKKKIIGIQCAKVLANGQVIFVRNLIRKVLQIAKIRNARLQSNVIGDQRKYFSSQNKQVYDLLKNKDLLLKRSGQDKIGVQQRKFYILKYPSKLELFFSLKHTEHQKQQQLEQQIKTWIQNHKLMCSQRNTGGKKALMNYLQSEDTKKQSELVQQMVGAPTSRLKITASMIADVLMQHYQWLFGAEQTFYRF